LATGWTTGVRFPAGYEGFFLHHHVRITGFWVHQTTSAMGITSKVKNVWSFSATPSLHLMALCLSTRENLSLFMLVYEARRK